MGVNTQLCISNDKMLWKSVICNFAGGVVLVHSCSGWMPLCLASRMNISSWSPIFRHLQSCNGPKGKTKCPRKTISRVLFVPSLKQTASLHLKTDGWNILLRGKRPIFRGELFVLGRVYHLFIWLFHQFQGVHWLRSWAAWLTWSTSWKDVATPTRHKQKSIDCSGLKDIKGFRKEAHITKCIQMLGHLFTRKLTSLDHLWQEQQLSLHEESLQRVQIDVEVWNLKILVKPWWNHGGRYQWPFPYE